MIFNRCYSCMQPLSAGPVCAHCGYDQRQKNKAHQLPPGTILQGQYLVGRVLGQGGFGITYLGWDLALDVPIAVKEYYPNGFVARDCSHSLRVSEYDGNRQVYFHSSRARFLREAKALARFSEIPEIVHVRNFFEENNTAYIVMEYIQGVELRQYINDCGGKLSPEETFTILKPVMKALSIVHKEDMVHRDISPDNIMLLPDGKVKLLDFGAVRDVENAEADKDLPKSTEAILKHGFAPMEQYQKRGALGPWTDVYALCATAYFCMTGQVPPDAPARMMDDIHPIWQGIPDLSTQMQTALEKGMAMLAKDRTASVQELYDQLFALPQTAAASADEQKNEDLPPPPPKKKKSPKWIALLAVCMLICVSMWFLLPEFLDGGFLLQAEQQPSPAETVSQTMPSTEEPVLEDREETAEAATEETEEPTAETVPEATQPPTTLSPETEPEADYPSHLWISNILVHSTPPEYLKDISTFSVFGSHIPRSEILSVTFLDSIENAPRTAWDASQSQNRSVLAWVEENGDGYDLYIGAYGGINAVYCCENLFAGFTNLRTVDFGRAFHMEGSPTLENMFYNCGNLVSVDVSGFDTSTVQYFTNMFYGCKNLEGLDVSSFDTSKAVQMGGMFNGCEKVPVLDVSGFNTKGVLNMSNMFSGCSSVKVLDVSGFDTRRVTDFRGMFNGCSSVEILDVSGFRTNNALDLSYMFYGCNNVKELDVTGFKTFLVLAMDGMFGYCSSLEALDTSSFNTKNCHGMSAMFSGCSNLKTLDIRTLTTNQATSLRAMFSGCQNLETLDIRKFSTENTTDMSSMFADCSSLKELDVSKLSTIYVTDMSYMFHNCSSLETLDVTNFMTNRVTNMAYMFYGTTDLVEFNFNKFVTSKVVSYSHFMNDGVIVNGRYWEDLFA